MQEERNHVEGNKRTRELFLDTLTKIGCQYELPEDENSSCVFFTYQDKRFAAIPKNDSQYIHIFDTFWVQMDLCDIDAFARLRKAINESNLRHSVTTVYIEIANKVCVQSKSCIWFAPHILQTEEYLRAELNEFFRAHLYVSDEMTKQRGKEESDT